MNKPSNRPFFSIIVPIYNIEKYLKKCVDSILSQDYNDFELLLIDDGSRDSSSTICDEYAEKDSRIKVIHKPNGGLVSARNKGVETATGQYICYVDGDDWVGPHWLQKIYKVIIKHKPDIVLYDSVKKYVDREEKIFNRLEPGFYDKEMMISKIYPYLIYDKKQKFCHNIIFPVAWNKIYKSEILKKHYCREEKIRMGEDHAFSYECMLAANSVYYVDEVLYYYNQTNINSMTSTYDKNRFNNNEILFDYIKQNIDLSNYDLSKQFNVFKAHWIIMGISHEVKSHRKISISTVHIRTELKIHKLLQQVKLKGLPFIAGTYILILKLHLYRCALILAKIFIFLKGE